VNAKFIEDAFEDKNDFLEVPQLIVGDYVDVDQEVVVGVFDEADGGVGKVLLD
jgi:hypothetical protein